MLIQYDPDEYESVSVFRTCRFHQINPGESYAGCTCYSSFGSRRRPPEEIARIKAERQRKEEDHILSQAQIIKARRENPNG